MEKSPTFQEALETVEALPPDEQAMLADIIQKRLRQRRREELLDSVAQAEKDYALGNVCRGSVADFMAALDE